jgi:hypothetical protein
MPSRHAAPRAARPQLQPLPPLPYGVANDPGLAGASRALSDAINAVNEHCRQIEWRRMALALQQQRGSDTPSRSR